MKPRLLWTIGVVVLAMIAYVASPGNAQTTANGPYYAPPSWDQTLPSSTRFIILSNFASNSVLDRETGLVWEKSPSTGTFTWLNAHSHCNTLNLGNRKGWRLPTLQELASLVDGDPANTSSPRLPPGHPFIGVQSSDYWSATTIGAVTSFAWHVFFLDGVVGFGGKSELVFAWCVRGGQGVDPQ